MSKKEKVLGFVKRHKTMIAYVMGFGAACVGMGLYMRGKIIVSNERVGQTLLHAQSNYNKMNVLTGRDVPFGAEDLGKMGEKFKDVIGDNTFTHVIMIGEDKT